MNDGRPLDATVSKRIILTEDQFDALLSSTEPPPGAARFAVGCIAVVAAIAFVVGFIVRGVVGG